MAHIHSVYDTDTHFIIDGDTRVVKNVSATKTMVVQHDHNSERFTFELPRYIDGHDMSTCNLVEVHFLNVDSQTKKEKSGIYEIEDLQVSPEDENVVICSWLISGSATWYVGKLYFVVRFCCVTGSLVTYAWSTAIHQNVSVSEGILAENKLTYDDVVIGGQAPTVSANNTVRIGTVELLASAWVGDASPYSQVVTISGVTPYSKVELDPSVEQLVIFHDKDLAFTTENEDGVVTVYAIGDKPQNDYTMQVTIKEVSV